MASSLKALTVIPNWVPVAVRLYLIHTESGYSLRQIARDEGLHPSTVLRQVRRFENRRDDILIDSALNRLKYLVCAAIVSDFETINRSGECKRMTVPKFPKESGNAVVDDTVLTAAALRVLRRLCEPGAVLAVASEMDRAVVLRDGPDGAIRLAVVDRPLAEAFALRDWIVCRKSARVSQYVITATGRAMLRRLVAGMSEDAEGAGEHSLQDGPAEDTGSEGRAPPGLGETPVMALARRRDRNGAPFLAPELVVAAERLREDFEVAQTGPRVTQGWEVFLTGGVSASAHGDRGSGAGQSAARERVAAALRELGPGLGDMALRCCCYLEGLEAAERRLGWSARSGKIVLRIALMRLHRHYAAQGDAGKMIG